VWTAPVYTHEEETQKLSHGGRAAQRVIAQEDSIQCRRPGVRARGPLKDPKRPSVSFLFLSPLLVGKTELARPSPILSRRDLDDQPRHVRVQWRSPRSSAWGAFASPPATSATRRAAPPPRPSAASRSSVVLFDEIEKGHPDLFNTLLRSGRRAASRTPRAARSLPQPVLIHTSNLGTADLPRPPRVRRSDEAVSYAA